MNQATLAKLMAGVVWFIPERKNLAHKWYVTQGGVILPKYAIGVRKASTLGSFGAMVGLEAEKRAGQKGEWWGGKPCINGSPVPKLALSRVLGIKRVLVQANFQVIK